MHNQSDLCYLKISVCDFGLNRLLARMCILLKIREIKLYREFH